MGFHGRLFLSHWRIANSLYERLDGAANAKLPHTLHLPAITNSRIGVPSSCTIASHLMRLRIIGVSRLTMAFQDIPLMNGDTMRIHALFSLLQPSFNLATLRLRFQRLTRALPLLGRNVESSVFA